MELIHKYKVGDILYFVDNGRWTKCEITELFHLVYKSKYPTYKIRFIADYFMSTGLKIEKSIAPECMLDDNKY